VENFSREGGGKTFVMTSAAINNQPRRRQQLLQTIQPNE